jgi:hypothetical protein
MINKMKQILDMRNKLVTLRWLDRPPTEALVAHIQDECDIIVKDCDKDRVYFYVARNGRLHSLPLEEILIAEDEKRHRPALRHKP